MDDKTQIYVILDSIKQAAFSVEMGIITHVNSAAAHYLLQPGTDVQTILVAGKEEFGNHEADCLYLTLDLTGHILGATATRITDTYIFLLEEPDNRAQLQTLALAAAELRQPLASAMALTDQIQPDTNSSSVAQLNQRMLQLQRIIGNMSDCADYDRCNTQAMEYTEVCSLLEEQLSRIAQTLNVAGLTFLYDLPSERIYTMAYPQKLERAVYNLVSNAAKFSPQGGTIQAQLTRNGNQLAFSVTDQGPGLQSNRDVFTRYLRQPGVEDVRLGLGLGMVLIRSTAVAHGGTVLIDHPEGVGIRVTMTMAITQSKSTLVRSPAFRIDYAGERDHCLLELSDVLPASLYREENSK